MDSRPPPPRRKRRGREELESLDLLATQQAPTPPPSRGRLPITFHPPPQLPPPAPLLPFSENNAAPLSSWGQRWHSWDPVQNRAEPLPSTPLAGSLVAVPARQVPRLPMLFPATPKINPTAIPQARSYTRPREWSAEDDVRDPPRHPRISRSQRKLLEVRDLAEQRQWTMVSEHVRTRSAAQCRNRWELLKGVLAADAAANAPAEEPRARSGDDTADTDYSDSADAADRDGETEAAAAKVVRVQANTFQEADDAVIRDYMLQGRQPHTEIWYDRVLLIASDAFIGKHSPGS